ncbi:MAG TPA: DUF4239 domain-containing protein [Gemmatimonadaceae bacterium]|nr:DUF4239 domain-containing protein [Gemmatimonadaceae bacterium]
MSSAKTPPGNAMDTMSKRLVIVLVTLAVTMLAVNIVRRHAPHAKMKDNHEFGGLMYQVLGLIYGVYLAFTIIAVWEQFGDADKTATNEATHLSELWRDAQVFPASSRTLVQDKLYTYTKNVVDKEWPNMAVGKGAEATTANSYEDLWNAYYAVPTATNDPKQAAFYEQSIHELNELGMLRRLRMLEATAALPSLMWGLLLGGGAVTIAFMFVFGTRVAATQYAVTGVVSTMLVFSILMVGALEHPFQGDVSIKPDAFSSVLQSMDQRLARQRTDSTLSAPTVGQAGTAGKASAKKLR